METNFFRYVWQKSRSAQITVLLIIMASIPFYWASFDVPKRIVNDAIQGRAFKDGKEVATLFDLKLHLPDFLGGHTFVLSDGLEFGQIGYLIALSCYFLMLVLINGAFKYTINLRKGILGERMLRRIRYDLFSQLMRFRPEDIRTVKPAEVASMIKDEVEPIGGFVGDAFIQPVFLLTQALTALAFIMVQSFWLGAVALFIVLMQAVIIPALRREQLRLGRERQVASRYMAGRIGEIIDAALTIQGHGTTKYFQADIASRLGNLFDIRLALYKRKFAVKFLNNLLAQITPFFFYAVGGYFALRGSLDIGQLVAVIAAYRDLPPPIKELIDWDQQRADVIVKYEQVINQFNPTEVLKLEDGETPAPLPPTGEIKLDNLQVVDNRGYMLLSPLTATIARPATVALVGPVGSGRDVLAQVLGRHVTSYNGRVTLDGEDLATMSVQRSSRLIGYAGQDVEVLQGSLRDNVTLSVKRKPPDLSSDFLSDPERQRRFSESLRSGNILLPFEADWLDYESLGIQGPAELDRAICDILHVLGVADDVYELGLNGKLSMSLDDTVAERIIEARKAVAAELAATQQAGLVETFDPNRYNSNASIAENLFFGTLRDRELNNERFLANPYALSILQAEALIEPLAEIGAQIVTTLVEMFEGLPRGHVLFERYAFSGSFDLEELNELAGILAKRDPRSPLDPTVERKLVTLALGYTEPRYRLNLVTDTLRQRILRARESFRTFLPASLASNVEFYDPERIIHGASVRDNLLFGRIGFGIPDAGRKVAAIVKSALDRSGLDTEIYRLGLDTDTGINGRYLPARLRLAIPLARVLIKRPQIYLLDPGPLLAVLNQPAALLTRLRKHCRGQTLFLLLSDDTLAKDVDVKMIFEGPNGRVERQEAAEAADRTQPDAAAAGRERIKATR